MIVTANSLWIWRFLPQVDREFSDFCLWKIYSPTNEQLSMVSHIVSEKGAATHTEP